MGQDAPKATDGGSRLRVVIGEPAADASDSVIVVPAETSAKVSVQFSPAKSGADPEGLRVWLASESEVNGLESEDLQPWHIVIAYDQFGEDGAKTHSGVVEELWAGPKKYKIRYKSDTLNQTDYATEHGFFRVGDQRWPNQAEMQARNEIVDPFFYAATLEGIHLRSLERRFGTHSMSCVLLERASGVIGSATQYCFDTGGTALRYSRGYGWFQSALNDIVSFEGRNVAREVEVRNAGKPYLKLQVKTLERLSQLDAAAWTPPADAVNFEGKRLSGVNPKVVQQPFPEWPDALTERHFSVAVAIVIGRDGHVVSAHAVSGPPEAYKTAERTAMRWTFEPYLVLDEPAEVETTIVLNNN